MSKLYLIPVPIAENALNTLPEASIQAIHNLDLFFVERLRSARRFLLAIKHPIAIDDMHFIELDKNQKDSEISTLEKFLKEGKSIGLLSESGVTCVADPGNLYVAKAHELSAQVIPLVGPSSILLALMASGLNGQNFHFHGYLPVKENDLRNKIRSITSELSKTDKTHIFIETPYRNKRLFDFLLKHIPKEIRLCVAIDINSKNERIISKSIKSWKNTVLEISKENAIFLLGI